MYVVRWFIFVVFLSTSFCYSQETSKISGEVYSSDKLLKDIKVINLRKNRFTYTDEEGRFEISAEKNDSILFSSIFFEEKIIVIKSKDLKLKLKIDLNERINELDEVIIEEAYIAPDFDQEKFNSALQEQIINDIKNNPSLYDGTGSSGNMDIMKIVGMISGLFKKKKDSERVPKAIVYQQFSDLFERDPFFTEKLLTEELKISKEYKGLFFMYCEAQEIDVSLLDKDQQFELLDVLVIHSQKFFQSINDAHN